MSSRATSVALVVFVATHVAVILAPAAILAVTADKGGVPGAHGAGLLVASGAVGVTHAVVVWRRLRRELRGRVRAINASIASFNSLVVLALAVTLLLFVFLGGYAPFAAVLVNAGWPVVALWVAVQVAAVAIAETVRVTVMSWLEA